MEKKICSKCGFEKEVCEFYKVSGSLIKYRSKCKICMNTYSRNYHEINKTIVSEKNKKFRMENPNINKEKCKLYKQKNPGWFKKWLDKNKEHRRNYIMEYNSNPKIKIKNSLRGRINELMNKKYNNPKTLDLLGCEYEYFIKYIENKFMDGMSWDNYGYYGWHLDHIIPLSSAKTEEEIANLFHYTNLQPLWANDNLKKSNKIL